MSKKQLDFIKQFLIPDSKHKIFGPFTFAKSSKKNFCMWVDDEAKFKQCFIKKSQKNFCKWFQFIASKTSMRSGVSMNVIFNQQHRHKENNS